MKIFNLLIFFVFLAFYSGYTQTNVNSIPLTHNKQLISWNVLISDETYLGKESLKVLENGGSNGQTFVKIPGLDFGNGIIEIDLAGKPGKDAPEQARGFVGVSFRINQDNSKYECIYLRPTNGRANDQVRRNHSVQYISWPDFDWPKMRKEFPEKYETYVDLSAGEWTNVKIIVNGNRAELYVHGNPQPTLIVNDLKLGSENRGSVGLWIGPGTEAHFANLTVKKTD